MAKMQRWRRRGSAGEDTGTVEQTTSEQHDLPGDDVGELGADPADAAAPAQDDGASGFDDVADHTVPQPEVPAAHDGEGEVFPEDDHPTDHESTDPDPAGDEPSDDEPAALPHVPESNPIARALLGGRLPAEVTWVQLLQAAHAKQAVTTALAVALAAALTGRAPRETGVVFATVLIGQTVLGWHNDIVDRDRDRRHGLTAKPIAMGRLTTETAWYAVVVAVLLLVPLAVTTGIRAGCFYLGAVAVGMLGNVLLRKGLLSWWSWAVSFALVPAYLSYGGWGGQAVGDRPETAIVVLAAVLGVGVHFTRSVWGLVADHEDGWTYLPLKLGLRIGATRLLALSTVLSIAVVIAMVVVASQVGLRA
ncbi:UbiA family prenyltransferase [Nocardioides sp.]|uniref:UbiA family prenyltransferase n=1 Tax=Nocardioides sp. TaxID=35761 RepID=UPI0035196B05